MSLTVQVEGEILCSVLLTGHGSRWSAPRELPHQQCSAISHFGRAHGKEAGANDETCLGRRSCLSRTHPLTRLHTITCLDSWVRRMAQITGRKPGAAHRPLARSMKRPSSTALRQGCSPPEFTHGKRMTGSLRPSNGRRERMEIRKPEHKPEPQHPSPPEAPPARHHLRRPAGQTPAVEHRLHHADKQLVPALPQTRRATQQGRRRRHSSNSRRQGTGHSPRGAKAYAKCRTGPRRAPRREAQASLTAPCTVLDSLRLKREGEWCRPDRPPQPGTEPASGFSRVRARCGPVTALCQRGPLADSRPLGKPLVITRCGHSVPMSQVREVICQQGGQHVLDVSAPSSLRARCVHCCDLRAGSEDTTTHKPQSMLPWPDHAPHGCSHPEQRKTDSGPDAHGLKQPPDQPEVRVDPRCTCNMDEDELMLHACLRAEQLLQNLAAVSGKPGLDAITEDQLIQASAMYHCSITQELKGGLITDRAAKAARKVAGEATH